MASLYEKRPWVEHYPEEVPSDLEVVKASALDVFEATVSRRPQAAAVHYFDSTMTYKELNSLADSLAAALFDLGMRKGDRVILYLQNVPQFLIGQYAIWKLGGIVVPLNPMYKEKELEYYCNDCEPKVLICLESGYPVVKSVVARTKVKTVITTNELDFLSTAYPTPKLLRDSKKEKPAETLDLVELLGKYQGVCPREKKPASEDVGHLIYTSGTTGPPKGAMNTHGNIVFNSRVFQTVLQLGSDDVVLAAAPLFHVTGTIAHLAVASLVGIPVILFYRFDAEEALRLTEKWAATMIAGSITVFFALSDHRDLVRRDLSSLRKVLSGGAPVPAAFVDKFEQRTGIYIHNIYGLTETTSPSHMTPLRLRAPVDPESGALSIGFPVPSCYAKIVDIETGQIDLAPGEVGEIAIKGPMVIPGYWGKPEETANAIRNKWLYTGDVGKMDKDGWFYVVDRKKDLINVSGFKVWPRDVEDVLYQHPAVKEACVVGVPDSYRGETVKAFIAVSPGYEGTVTPEEIIEFCRQRMAAYKYPRMVKIVPEIPKTVSGKFLRRVLRDER
jgi:long-chain acyl-CoA synthetase